MLNTTFTYMSVSSLTALKKSLVYADGFHSVPNPISFSQTYAHTDAGSLANYINIHTDKRSA